MGISPSRQEEIIRLAAEAGAKAGIEAWHEQARKFHNRRVDTRLQNTKLLLRHYRALKIHVQRAIYSSEQVEKARIGFNLCEVLDEEYGSPKLFVESIKQSTAKTILILEHVDEMLEAFKGICALSQNPEKIRRAFVIQSHYIDKEKKTIEELARECHVTIRTIYRDIDCACVTLGALFFGIDGVKKV